MDKLDKKRRIERLQKKYSETNVGMDEVLFKPSIQRINKNYYDNQKRRRVDGVLNEVKNRNSIKEEVHQICSMVSFNKLCSNCKDEFIIAVIILYVTRTRVKDYRIDRTGLWNRYDITWKKYANIISNLLKEVRENYGVVE